MYGRIYGMNAYGDDIINTDFYRYNEGITYYMMGEAGVPIYFELTPYFNTDEFTLTLSEFVATGLDQTTPQLITYSEDPQYFVFNGLPGGVFNLILSTTEYISLDLRYFGNYLEMPMGTQNIGGGESVTIQQFMPYGQVFFLEINNGTLDGEYTIEWESVSIPTVTEGNPIVINSVTYNQQYFEIVVTEPSNLEIEFLSNSSAYLYGEILDSNGWYEGSLGGSVDDVNPYVVPVFLTNGSYYVRFYTDMDVSVTVSITAIPMPVIYTQQEVFVEITDGQDRIMVFMPNVSADYVFYSYNNSNDPYITVYDTNGYEIAYNDDQSDLNFELHMWLEAGQTYIIHFGDYGYNETYNVMVDQVYYD